MHRSYLLALLACCALPLAQADETVAVDAAAPLQTVVVQATALPGDAVNADQVPGDVESLGSGDLARHGSPSLTGALSDQLGSVNVDDNLDDPFQPDILYRGFEASPVLGTPQGLAVYQNGVRINEAFGDTVNWDLLPDVAIEHVELVSANPVYGLNALGGAVSVKMKTGFDFSGAEAELSDGSFAQRSGTLQLGARNGAFAVYVAARALNENGRREFSNDSLRQLYAVLSAHSDNSSFDLSYSHADNHLNGQGSAPVQELALNRSLVFTGPQTNINRLDFLTLSASTSLTDHWSLQAVGYYRQYGQRVDNGNTTDYIGCTDPALAGQLCQSDGSTPLVNSAGAALPDISAGGSVVIGENDFERIHAYGRGFTLQTSSSQDLLGHGNHFSAGASLDYAAINFYSGAQVGVIDSQLLVEPSDLIVDTPEGTDFDATPVLLLARNQALGLYATDTIEVTSALALTTSARYNHESVDLVDGLGSALTGDNHYSHFNPALGATLELTPQMTAYAGIAQTTRTPTASEIECSDPTRPCLLPSNLAGDPPTLKQVVAHSLELGLRGRSIDSDAHSAFSWHIGLFRTHLDDDIYGISTSVASGFFQNIGATRRQGLEAALRHEHGSWSSYIAYSYVDATFQSSQLLPSPSNPFQDDDGNIQVNSGDHLPGIPRHRFKLGVDDELLAGWRLGASLVYTSSQYFFGDESNQNPQLPGHTSVGLHTTYQVNPQLQLFARVDNLFNTRYATYGVLSDPTGVGTPGVPADGVSNGPGVDNRFESPAAPIAAFAGVRLRL